VILMAPYELEQEIFKDQYATTVPDESAQIIVNKMARHFKLRLGLIKFYGGRQSGMAYQHENFLGKWSDIRLSHTPSLGLICHELAHAYEHKVNKVHRHGSKGFIRSIQKFVNYGTKKNWWAEEIKNRTALKEPKAEPTKNAIRMDKIERTQKKIKHYESKVKFYTNKLKKAKKSLKMLVRYHEQEVDKDIENEIMESNHVIG
jgi:hypothetical protein